MGRQGCVAHVCWPWISPWQGRHRVTRRGVRVGVSCDHCDARVIVELRCRRRVVLGSPSQGVAVGCPRRAVVRGIAPALPARP